MTALSQLNRGFSALRPLLPLEKEWEPDVPEPAGALPPLRLGEAGEPRSFAVDAELGEGRTLSGSSRVAPPPATLRPRDAGEGAER